MMKRMIYFKMHLFEIFDNYNLFSRREQTILSISNDFKYLKSFIFKFF